MVRNFITAPDNIDLIFIKKNGISPGLYHILKLHIQCFYIKNLHIFSAAHIDQFFPYATRQLSSNNI